MPAPRNKLIQPISDAKIRSFVGLRAFNYSRKITTEIKEIAEVPEPFGGVCPYDMSKNRPESRGNHMSEEHHVRYAGKGTLTHNIEVDKDYAIFVYDGAQGSAPRPWIQWAIDRWKARKSAS